MSSDESEDAEEEEYEESSEDDNEDENNMGDTKMSDLDPVVAVKISELKSRPKEFDGVCLSRMKAGSHYDCVMDDVEIVTYMTNGILKHRITDPKKSRFFIEHELPEDVLDRLRAHDQKRYHEAHRADVIQVANEIIGEKVVVGEKRSHEQKEDVQPKRKRVRLLPKNT